MKTIALPMMIMWLCLTAGYAQDDSTRYINGLPVTEDDSVPVTSPGDRPPYNQLIPVPIGKLPKQLRRSLEQESQYEGWQDTTIYRDNNTGLYIVPLRRSDGIRIFGLDKKGDPVTFREVARHEDE